MSEISREEAIRELDVMGGNCSSDYDYKICHKAISDMQKLEKIEQILKEDCINDDSILCRDCEFNHCGGYCVETRMLYGIIKLYKNN